MDCQRWVRRTDFRQSRTFLRAATQRLCERRAPLSVSAHTLAENTGFLHIIAKSNQKRAAPNSSADNNDTISVMGVSAARWSF